MIRKLFIPTILCIVTAQIDCSIKEKITKSAEKITTLRQDVKSGKDLQNTQEICGGSNCCGNSCGRCGKD